MVPPPQPQQVPQPYYTYPQQPVQHARADVASFITRRVVFLVDGIGILLLWISLMALTAFNVTDAGVINLLQAVGITGCFLGFCGSLLGGLGSKQTDGNQNHGLLVLAGMFVVGLTILSLSFRF